MIWDTDRVGIWRRKHQLRAGKKLKYRITGIWKKRLGIIWGTIWYTRTFTVPEYMQNDRLFSVL